MRFLRFGFISLFALGACAAGLAQSPAAKPATKSAPAKPVALAPDELKWGPPPAAAMVGKPSVDMNGELSAAVVAGDPLATTGMYAIRLKCTDGTRIAPHWHPKTENVTVIQGSLGLGMGDQYDESAMRVFPTGSFLSAPAGMHHYAQCKGDTIIQIHGAGPFRINYIPAKPAAKKTGK